MHHFFHSYHELRLCTVWIHLRPRHKDDGNFSCIHMAGVVLTWPHTDMILGFTREENILKQGPKDAKGICFTEIVHPSLIKPRADHKAAVPMLKALVSCGGLSIAEA